MITKDRKNGITCLVFLFFLSLLFSCSSNSEKKSFISSLDEIDALINQKQYKQAVSELGKIEKIAYGSWAQLGIFRRYNSIGEDVRAEKILNLALKKNPENLELNAVYSNFLLRKNRLSEALQVGRKLSGTKYGSIYSEAVFQDILNKSKEINNSSLCENDEYYPVYYDAYEGSKNNAWLRNCALLHLKNGSYESASKLSPQDIFDSEDAYFWALVMYDSRRFGNCVDYLQVAKKFLRNKIDKTKKNEILVNIYCLESDSYTSLKDEEEAEKVRETFIKEVEKTEKPELLLSDERLALIYTNSARWAKDNLDDEKCEKLISEAVNQWPDYIPALTLYADFAYESNLPEKNDFVQLELRDNGVTTLEMEKFDNKVRIPLSDAKYRISECLKRKHDPLLYIVDFDLKYKTMPNMSDKEKCADLWNVLEDNALSPSVYPEVMMDYALSFLIKTHREEEAWTLFSRYLYSKYTLGDGDFWVNVVKNMHKLSPIDLEYAAFFSALGKNSDDALCLYEQLVYEKNEYSSSLIVSPLASIEACMNLSEIYRALGRINDSIDLYGKACGRCVNVKHKSLIMYRMAMIYFEKQDYKNSKSCAEYAVSLDKNNIDARFLLKRIKNA